MSQSHPYRLPAVILLCAALLLAESTAPPSVALDGVRNAASQIPPGLPGGAIAPGSMITIDGVRLASAAVSVTVEDAGMTFDVVPLSITDDRIVAVAPPGLSPGSARLMISHSGQQSLAREIRIVDSSFGIFTVTAGDRPPDLAALPHPLAHVPISPARPGQELTIWGTGLGGAREPEVYVANLKARVLEPRAESCCAGVESIRFELPAGSSFGCGVPVQVRTGAGPASNVVTIPISADGGACSDPAHWLLNVSAAGGNLGLITLVRGQFLEDHDPAAPEEFQYDFGLASFTAQQPDRRDDVVLPSVGGCITFTAMIPVVRTLAPPIPVKGREDEADVLPMQPVKLHKLDAGARLRVAGATGSRPLEPDPRRPRYYLGKFGGSVFPLFYQPGRYEVRGGGGADVGKFAARVRIPGDLQWTNREEAREIRRDLGARLRWTAADESQVIAIVAAGLDPASGATAGCLCLASAAAHEFEIPARILSSFPETRPSRDFQSSFILLAALPGTAPRPFQARGLDAGFAFYVSTSAKTVAFR